MAREPMAKIADAAYLVADNEARRLPQFRKDA
jgi:hypothetical protein